MKPADRIGRLPHQLFAALVEQVEAKRQQGIDVINLGQGNPDGPTPPHIVEALREAAGNPRYQRYISFRGLTSLKEAVAEWYWTHHQVRLDPLREVAILIGSKIGLEEISLALVNRGDRVLAPDPGYPDYLSGIALAGGELVPWPLLAEHQFLPDLTVWPDRIRLAFLNYPNNPTGATAPAPFYDAAIAQALRHGTILAHDLAYGDIVFDGKKSVSLLSRPGGKKAGIEFTTLSKSYNMAGWRIGFAAGNAEIIGYLELLQDHLNCSQWGAIQEAGRAALLGPQDSVLALRAEYQSRRDAFINKAARAGWKIPKSQGSIFLWCPVPATQTALKWAETFLEASGVVVAPGSGFGSHGEGFIRIALTEPIPRLEEAAQRMASVMAG
ncbi:aminotransferase class I/II-fold pyridoxal phosphate-dependent enzyme [Sulfobacillus sp. DSM 109850]|uniref:Aminotransferase class I/II-fold pyridoxal phosphate-dependent enzyme n=2 Tax=Sulfobacillus harzensis TaxID=2729629 RepID=A0A7Y0L1I9_9FIRM|nr:aminotransferase class I/II-fold pyridoxal phosphate-dependent enzyme [Sulfobacillus harzensis]